MRKLLLASAAVFALSIASAVHAAEPVNATAFNVKTDIDLKSLNKGNFLETLLPKAKADGAITFYDFGESEKDLFAEIIRRFEKKTGLTVNYRQVNGEQAVQQLIAAHKANQPSPVDVFWMPNGQVRVANEAGIIANLPLNSMLPSAPDLDDNPSTVSRGYRHGGVVVPFHRNLTAIGFDTRAVPEGKEPKTFDELLAFAKANPGKVAITNPTKGGSGGGFLETAILALTSKDCQARLYDYTVSNDEAKAWAASNCLDPVMAYFKELKPHVEFTNGNSDTLTLIANGQAVVGTVWEDMVFDFIGRGLLPPAVHSRLMTSGQVGDGDGAMIPADTKKLAGALLFLDYLMSDEIQLYKLSVNGSRTARVNLDIGKALGPDVVAKLVPDDQYRQFARPRIVGNMSSEAAKRFVASILQ